MFDHLGFAVKDINKSRAFYVAALHPLGITIAREGDGWAAFGEGSHTAFWIGSWGKPPGGLHVAFTAKDRAAVRAFHEAGLKHGGIDNGKPGIRENYHPNYYAAFVIDPDGHNIEAVCHKPEA